MIPNRLTEYEKQSETVPNSPSQKPVSTWRSSLGTFDWESAPSWVHEQSTFYKRYPLPYDDVFTDIQTDMGFQKLYETYPQVFPEGTYTSPLLVSLGTDSTDPYVHSQTALSGSARETVKNLFQLPKDISEHVDHRESIGEVTFSCNDDFRSLDIEYVSVEPQYMEYVRDGLREE
jgi:hypothetical protein